MKKYIRNIFIICLFCLSSESLWGVASIDDLDQLVVKFEDILKGLNAKDPLRLSVTLRLADLLLERGQQKKIDDSKDCKECTSGHADLKRALSLYEFLKNKPSFPQQERIFFQIGHINEVLNRSNRAIQAYTQVIQNFKLKHLHSKAYIALGELFYKENAFKKAKTHFLKGLQFDISNKGFIFYRVAWCDYHLGQTKSAVAMLFKLLMLPKVFLLKSDGSSSNKEIDILLQEEVSRDLATFLAKADPSQKDIDLLYELSPQDWKRDNMVYLAKELFRLGHIDKSLLVWQKIKSQKSSNINQVQASIWISKILIEKRQEKRAVKEISYAFQNWQNVDCRIEKQKCDDLKEQIRESLVVWYKNNETHPVLPLLQAYRIYLKRFDNDLGLIYLAGDLAQKLKLFKESIQFYKIAIRKKLQKTDLNQQNKKKDMQESLEDLLLSRIKAAELSENIDWKREAYNDYIQHTHKGEKWFEVVYLRAKLFYDQNQYEKAAIALKAVAMMDVKKQEAQKIKLQAAHLALDALVLAKNDKALEKMSLDFMQAFPDKADEFLRVHRTSILNQTRMVSQDPSRAWTILERINLSGATDQEKIKYYKNKLILADKLRRVSDEIQIIAELLQIESLSNEDKNFALKRRIYLAELLLDFPTMYNLTQKLELKELELDKKALRLAFFAELADKDYTRHYHEFLQYSNDPQKQFDVAIRLLQEASDQTLILKKYKDKFFQDPERFADFLLENYIDNKNKRFMLDILKQEDLQHTVAVQVLLRDDFLKEIEKAAKEIAQHQIRTSRQSLLERDLKKRLDLFEKLEEKMLKAKNLDDWMSQVIVLSLIERENQRLYSDLMVLPLPPDLNMQEEKKYFSILETRANPYKEQASLMKVQINDFFKDTDFFAKLTADMNKMTKAIRMMSKSHLETLTGYLSKEHQIQIQNVLKAIEESLKSEPSLFYRPSDLNDPKIEAMRDEIRKDPFNVDKIKKLIVLEQARGYQTMVNYLRKRRLSLLDSK